MDNKKSPDTISADETLRKDNISRNTKTFNMIDLFATGKPLHRFQAERYGDHVLPTTVSTLTIDYGLNFMRQRVKVPNRFGSETSVMSYWLEGNALERARRLVRKSDGKR